MRGRFILPRRLETRNAIIDLTDLQFRVYICLMDTADDYGRELAHPVVVAGNVHKPVEQVKEALATLEQLKLIELYEVDTVSYYFICNWFTWNSMHKLTPSQYPVPPSQISPDSPGKSRPEEEVEVEPKGERESKSITSVVVAPPTHDDDHGVRNSVPSQSRGTTGEGTITHLVDQVAGALKIPVHDELLVTLVRDYTRTSPQISLVSEAHAARLWINGPKNTARKGMSSVFFKGWLDRERRSCTPVPPAPADTGGAKETPPMDQYTTRSLDPEYNRQQLERMKQALILKQQREAANHG